MRTKPYHMPDNESVLVDESATTFGKLSSSDAWNPNVPFHGTQEEWWEHFHRIEEGNFMTLEEFDHKFETWKTKYLASKLK